MRGVLLCVLSLFACALAHPASELQEAWENRDEKALQALHTPTCWSDEQVQHPQSSSLPEAPGPLAWFTPPRLCIPDTRPRTGRAHRGTPELQVGTNFTDAALDSGRRLYQQIVGKSLEFRLVEYRVSGSQAQAVGVFDVYREGELVDRVFAYFEDDMVVAYDEQQAHAELFLLDIVPGRLRLNELAGSPALDAMGQRYLQAPAPEFARHFVEDVEFVRSHWLHATGRALLVYRNPQEEFAMVAVLQGREWRPLAITYLPGPDDLIPQDAGLLQCATNMKSAVDQLEETRTNQGVYPREFSDKLRCPTSGRPYKYAVTIDFQWYGLVCEGDSHGVAHYPAASRSSGLRVNSTGHTDYGRCSDNIEKLLAMLEDYKALHGRYPQVPAYLADRPGVHLPSCSSSRGIRAHNETDYAFMHLPGGLHVFCTTVEHCGEGFAPLQPSYIDGLPSKAMFMLKTNPASARPPAPRSP